MLSIRLLLDGRRGTRSARWQYSHLFRALSRASLLAFVTLVCYPNKCIKLDVRGPVSRKIVRTAFFSSNLTFFKAVVRVEFSKADVDNVLFLDSGFVVATTRDRRALVERRRP